MLTRQFLRLVLFLGASTLISAIVPLFFSPQLMNEIHQKLGLGDFPIQPISIYLAKSACLLYAIHGMVLLFVAIRFDELKSMIPFLAWLHVGLGSVMIYVDAVSPMPIWWLVIEGPPVIGLGFLLFALYRRAKQKGQL